MCKSTIKKSRDLTGNDLFLSESKIVRARPCELIRTYLHLEISENYNGEIFGRSGLALRFDSDYRGVACFVAFNNSDNDYKILSG